MTPRVPRPGTPTPPRATTLEDVREHLVSLQALAVVAVVVLAVGGDRVLQVLGLDAAAAAVQNLAAALGDLVLAFGDLVVALVRRAF